MKTLFTILAFVPFLVFGQTDNAYKVNNSSSKINWTGYGEVGSYSLVGDIKLKQGTFNFDGVTLSKGNFVFDMPTISHENKDLVKHLKNEDFFEVTKYPTATFQLQEIKNEVATGLLNIKNIQKTISFPVKITKKGNQVLIAGTIGVDRTLFNINYNSNSFFSNLGNYAIKNNFDLAFSLVAEQIQKSRLPK